MGDISVTTYKDDRRAVSVDRVREGFTFYCKSDFAAEKLAAELTRLLKRHTDDQVSVYKY